MFAPGEPVDMHLCCDVPVEEVALPQCLITPALVKCIIEAGPKSNSFLLIQFLGFSDAVRCLKAVTPQCDGPALVERHFSQV